MSSLGLSPRLPTTGLVKSSLGLLGHQLLRLNWCLSWHQAVLPLLWRRVVHLLLLPLLTPHPFGEFSSVIFILSLRMDSIVIDQSPQLGLLLAAWRVFFLKLYNRGSLSEGGYYFLLAILTDKSQEALDTEFNPLVISWLKFTLPKIMRARRTLRLLNLMNPSSPTWRNDYLYRHRCLLYLERRANLLVRP